MPPTKMSKPQSGSAHTSGIFADMTVDGPIIGDLVVVVDRARNLPNRKTMGKQDPYCAARLGKEAKKTETDRRGGQTPRWDQELRFVVHESPDYLKLKLSIFNEDRKTELIGEAWIDLKDVIVRGGGHYDSWHRLNCKGRPSGEVRMEITFYDTREKPADAPVRSSRQAEKLNVGPRELPTRRPLPRGPGGVAVPHSASTSQVPTRPHLPVEAAQQRHMSTDATEQGPIDPYKHRQKMLAMHGLPFDPNAQTVDDRLTHHGGPRPVPGQSFSDLDRLRYRNRGVAIPEGLIQDEQQQRPRRNTFEPPVQHEPEPELEPVQMMEEPAQESHSSHHYQHQAEPQPSYSPHESYMPQQPHPFDPQPYDAFDGDFVDIPDCSNYQQPYVEPAMEEAEGPPPPPPAHRSNIVTAHHTPSPTRYEPEPPAPSLQHGLARLNAQNGDDFYQPVENSTQLTTHSDMAAPGYADAYNHGHRPSPRHSHGGQGYSPAHQRSMQDMRGPQQNHRYSQYDTPVRQQNHHSQRMSYDHRNNMQEDFRSSGPPAPIDQFRQQQSQHQAQRHQEYDSGYDSLGEYEMPSAHSQPHHLQYDHNSTTPIVKPRAISPNANSPHYQPPPSQQEISQYSPSTASSNSPSSIQRKSIEPRISDTAFSPDSFDVLNPQVKARTSSGHPDAMTKSPYANGGALESAQPEEIRDTHGRLVDPSDHLPTHTWAPEPEPKKPLKAEVKLRFKGAVPMPATGQRGTRPDVPMPAVRSSVFSPHLNDKPGAPVDGKDGRNRLQKKVRVMMTSGGRRERKAEKKAAEMEANLAWAADAENKNKAQPLADIPHVNYGAREAAPPLPPKIPMDVAVYEESVDTGMGMEMGSDELTREMSTIDLGTYTGRGNRRARFATTLM